ncbi:hypothetical protein JVT61DRAFT_476 [Boletus reticuloceps]|uniref:DUF6533 domain-containing protein n=1 Tax=Boletus reticuloceps TaxID=495285 RepID=A0A8I2Z3I9_9AGAM|nr:hypothetical protein JVT61DRAFT_476 [Boletus reticuloceps]
MSGFSPHDKAVAFKVAISASEHLNPSRAVNPSPYSKAISFAIMMVDFVWLMRDEVKYVWLRLRTSWTARIYIFTKYTGLVSQIYNVYFTVRMFLGVYTSPRGCRFWFMYQAITVQFLLLFAEGLLMHRLYALFLHNRLILVMLIMFALSQVVSMWVSTRLSFPSNKHTVTCLMVRSNPGNAFFSATTMTTNVIIAFMTFWRYFRLPVKWTRGALGRLVLRDSACSLGAITMIMFFLTLCSLEVIKFSMSGNITYYWLICVLWVSIGRIVVDHEKLRDEGEEGEGNIWKGTLQLTSQIEIGESESSLDTRCGSSDGRTPTPRTLPSPLSMPMTKANQLSSSSACTGDSPQKWLGDRSPSCGDSSEPSSTVVSTYRLSLPNVRKSNGDASRAKDQPWADAGERVHSSGSSSRRPSPQSSSSEPTLSEAPS